MGKPRKRKNAAHELEDSGSFSKLSSIPSIKMPDGEVISEREWKRRFDTEHYYGDRFGDFTIMKTDKQKKESRRNNNTLNRDALSKAERTGDLRQLTNSEHEFMQDASDEWEWQDVYKIGGFEHASEVIYNQAMRDIIDDKIDLRVTLTRFLIKMIKLKTLRRRESTK